MSSRNGNFRTYDVHNFKDIISVRLDPEGNLKWSRNINKDQVGFDNTSFTSLPVDNTSYFFINGARDVKKLGEDRITFKHATTTRSNLYAIAIDGNGSMSYEKLIDDKDSKVYYKVNNGLTNLDANEVILIGKKKKLRQIVKLKIN